MPVADLDGLGGDVVFAGEAQPIDDVGAAEILDRRRIEMAGEDEEAARVRRHRQAARLFAHEANRNGRHAARRVDEAGSFRKLVLAGRACLVE